MPVCSILNLLEKKCLRLTDITNGIQSSNVSFVASLMHRQNITSTVFADLNFSY